MCYLQSPLPLSPGTSLKAPQQVPSSSLAFGIWHFGSGLTFPGFQPVLCMHCLISGFLSMSLVCTFVAVSWNSMFMCRRVSVAAFWGLQAHLWGHSGLLRHLKHFSGWRAKASQRAWQQQSFRLGEVCERQWVSDPPGSVCDVPCGFYYLSSGGFARCPAILNASGLMRNLRLFVHVLIIFYCS